MANIQPISPSTFSDVYQIETNDLVLGGAGQNANKQAESLVNRTQYLKDRFENTFSPKIISSNATIPISDLSDYSVEGSGISIYINDYTVVGFKLRIAVNDDTTINYTGVGGTSTSDTLPAGTYKELEWKGTYWEYTVPIENKVQTLTNKTINYNNNTLIGVQPTITGAGTTIASSNLIKSRALVSNSDGKVGVSSVTDTELGYLVGVTSSVQTQLNSKQANLSTAQQNAVDSGITSTKVGNYDTHISSTSNPHGVTKTQVGLGNCDNTSDLNKPISTATQTALNGKQNTLTTNQQNAVDSGITSSKVNNYDSHLSNTSNPHSVTKSQVGLGNCDNTSDLDKPISTATQTALDGKEPSISLTGGFALKSKSNGKIGVSSVTDTELETLSGVSSSIQTQLNGKQATIDSSHKLSADLVDDASTTNKFVTASDKSNWNGKQNVLDANQMNAVNSGATSTLIGKISTNESAISTINGKIPAEATTSNQLADKAFVTYSIQTNTTSFRGNWNNWASVPSVASDYPEDVYGVRTPSVNDYMIVNDASGYTGQTLTGTWRFKYTGVWGTLGKSGWLPEYQTKDTPLTPTQQSALDSGITSTKVGNYDSHLSNTSNPHSVTKAQVGLGNCDNTSDANKPISSATQTALNGKQSTLDATQMNAVNSGITSTLVGKISTNESAISTINGKIPTEASSSNKLADKSYVDTGLAGKEPTISLGYVSGGYMLRSNSSGKVAVSTIEVNTISGHLSNTSNPHSVTKSQVGLGNVDNTSDVNKPISTATQTALNGKQATIDGSHKLSADLVDDTSTTHKFVTSTEKSTWSGKQNALDTTQMSAVNSGINSTLVSKMVTTDGSATLLNKTIDYGYITGGNALTCTPRNIDSSISITPDKEMNLNVTGSSVTITLGAGPYVGYSLPIYAGKTYTITYTGVGVVSVTETVDAGYYLHYIWTGTYWIREKSAIVSITSNAGVVTTYYMLTRR